MDGPEPVRTVKNVGNSKFKEIAAAISGFSSLGGLYDVKDDTDEIESYKDLRDIYGLFQQVQLDQSRTCVFWNDRIDLPSDTIYEYGKVLEQV